MTRSFIPLIALIMVITASCHQELPDYYRFAGFTQGTTYSVIYDSGTGIQVGEMKEKVERLLGEFDLSLSNYNDSSLISTLNRVNMVSADSFMLAVLQRSHEIWEQSDGAFDITAGPLIKAWGFGPDATRNFKAEMLDSLMQLTGMGKVKIDSLGNVSTMPGMYIDVNAIAQGYSVDVICKYLLSMGVERCLVEVGGEVRAIGSKYPGEEWRVAIDKPKDNNNIPGEDIQAIILLADRALATSGNYRKFYEDDDGVKYVHTINPVTGYPVRHQLLSATIIADDCISADAFATACMVKGLEGAKKMLSELEQMEAYLVYSDQRGEFRTWYTEGMQDYIAE